MADKGKNQIISSLRSRIDEVTLGDRKAPQSVFSKEQTALLQAINESPLSVEEKNSLLRYLYFSAVRYMRCLESDIAKEVKQKEILKTENEKLRERVGKSSELIGRLQELNKALSDELELVKTKERNMIMEEKRIREQLIDKFVMSLDELNSKVEENSKTNSTLLDENSSLREEFRQRLEQYQEQARISKEMIAKLTEVNSLYEKQMDEMKGYMDSLAEKAKDAEDLRKAVSEYRTLMEKQGTMITALKEHRDKLSALVKQYEGLMGEKKAELKKKNLRIDELSVELASVKKELKKALAQVKQLDALCHYLQDKRKELEQVEEDDDLL
ncbi:hypothetical protein WA171_006015 [Blastocystis sp. BT1]